MNFAESRETRSALPIESLSDAELIRQAHTVFAQVQEAFTQGRPPDASLQAQAQNILQEWGNRYPNDPIPAPEGMEDQQMAQLVEELGLSQNQQVELTGAGDCSTCGSPVSGGMCTHCGAARM